MKVEVEAVWVPKNRCWYAGEGCRKLARVRVTGFGYQETYFCWKHFVQDVANYLGIKR